MGVLFQTYLEMAQNPQLSKWNVTNGIGGLGVEFGHEHREGKRPKKAVCLSTSEEHRVNSTNLVFSGFPWLDGCKSDLASYREMLSLRDYYSSLKTPNQKTPDLRVLNTRIMHKWKISHMISCKWPFLHVDMLRMLYKIALWCVCQMFTKHKWTFYPERIYSL